MNLHQHTIKAISKHAVAEYPREACGVVIVRKGRQRYYPCRNTHANPTEQFRMCPEDYAAAEDQGQVVAVVHTHPDASPMASDADRVQCEASGVPWFIFNVHREGDATHVGGCAYIEPCGYRAPLVGRQFTFGVLDCYTLVRDYYRDKFDIELPDFEREDGFWRKGQELYLDNFQKAGFERVTDGTLRVGDGILMQIRDSQSPACEVTNHAAVYVGDGLILHHLMGRMSSRDLYDGYYQQVTRMVVRHGGVKDGNA